MLPGEGLANDPEKEGLGMKSNIAVIAMLTALTGAAAGCAQEQRSAASSEGVVEEAVGTLLTSIEPEPGHVIRFYEIEPGLMVATESGQIEKQPPLLGQREIDSYVEVFESLAPDRVVPPALVAAEARREARRDQVSDSQPTDDDLVVKGGGPSFYTTAEQTWFRQTFCPYGTPKCIQGWDWIDSGWDYTTDWKTTAFVGSEGSVAAPHIAYWWKCSGGSCWWETLNYGYVSPGWYHWITGSGGWFYFKSTLTGAGGGTQVSMAIADGPYQCVHCFDGSCQCGYNVPDNLCAGHNGPDYSIGCIAQP
jgi:hypothetical protein